MSLDNLPVEWCVTTFENVISSISNGIGGKQNKESVGIPVTRIETISQAKIDFDKIGFIPEPDKKDVEKYKLNKGDILFSHINSPIHLGKTAIFQHDTILYHGINLLRIVVDDRIISYKFFNYFCNLIRSEGIFSLNAQHAVNQSSINQKKLNSFNIRLAPLAEQQEIVRQLDLMLAQVEQIKARLDAIPAILKKFRQSVLADAVSGKLTEEWREDSSTKEVSFEKWNFNEIPSSWDVKKYSEICESRLGKMLDKNKNFGVATKYLGNINVRWFNFDLQGLKEILVSENEIKELLVCKGDVLICEGGEPGRCAVWDKDNTDKIIFQKALHRARTHENVEGEWLAFNLKNDADNLSLNQIFTGTTIKHLTGKALMNYPLRVPPLNEQKVILARLKAYFTMADHLEHTIQSAQKRVNLLTQSILAKAFSGELTAEWREQHQELITGVNSAENLLAKIQAEREANKPVKKTRAEKEV